MAPGRLSHIGGLLAVIAAGTLLSGIALAAVHTSPSMQLPAKSSRHAVTNCGSGEVISGGGFAIKNSDTLVVTPEDDPVGKTAWLGRVAAFSGSGTSWRNYAICQEAKAKSVSIKAVTKPEKNGGVFMHITCPHGRRAIGGGWSITPPTTGEGTGSGLEMFYSFPKSTTTWALLSIVEVGDASGEMTGYAICSGRKVKDVVEKTHVTHTGTASATATCPSGMKPLSGGFNIFGYPGTVLASKPAGKHSWKVVAQVLDSPDSDAYVKAYAVCA
jgi:hypothetical protein